MSRCLIEWAGEPLDESIRTLAERAVDAALARDGLDGRSLCVLVAADAESARLHGAHFADPTPTDVMSFPDGAADPSTGLVRLGDLAVGLDVGRRVAAERGRPLADELALYVLHGALHLLGHDDVAEADRAEMWAVQRAVMDGLGVAID